VVTAAFKGLSLSDINLSSKLAKYRIKFGFAILSFSLQFFTISLFLLLKVVYKNEWVLLFEVVTLYKIATKTESANMSHCS
jgi:hypothetical protein